MTMSMIIFPEKPEIARKDGVGLEHHKHLRKLKQEALGSQTMRQFDTENESGLLFVPVFRAFTKPTLWICDDT